MIWELQCQLDRVFEEVVVDFLECSGSMGVSMDVDGVVVSVRGYFAQETPRSELEIQLRLALAAVDAPVDGIVLRWKLLPDCDWGEAWKESYHPLPIGHRLLVVPSWLEPALDNTRLVIRMDPQMAFGSGTHATTRGCLEFLEALGETRALGRVLDMGTGSGILAIWAALLGAERVIATDLDPIAVETANRNCSVNGVAACVEVIESEAVPSGPFGTIVANILAKVLIQVAPQLVAALALGGRLILSGILREQVHEVQMAFAQQGQKLVQMREIEEWAVLVLEAA